MLRQSYLKHSISILSRILQRARLLLSPRRRDQPVKLALRIRYTLHNLVKAGYISYIDLSVV